MTSDHALATGRRTKLLPASSLAAPPPFATRGRFRAVRRGVAVVLWTLPCAAVQAVLLRLPGSAKKRFARLYWRQVCRLLGLELRVVGTPARPAHRAVVFVSNHSSWLDIAVLGGVLHGRFIAKGEIARWPVINVVARLGRTVFVTRGRDTLSAEREAMTILLDGGDNLILFPEGTSSDGGRVLPFRSSFFSVADGSRERPPVVQPVSVVYDRLGHLPTGRTTRAVFAWYGDMDLASHYWQLAQRAGLRATVVLHEPIDPAPAAPGQPGLNRKEITRRAWDAVAAGAATLRQNRAAQPLGNRHEPAA